MAASRQEILTKLTALLKKRVVFALAFGSVLTEAFNEESDVDVGVYLSGGATEEEKNNLRYLLIKRMDQNVDVIFLNGADLIIAMQILANGQLIVNHSPKAFIEFKARKISEYIDFKISRRIVEETLVKGMKRA